MSSVASTEVGSADALMSKSILMRQEAKSRLAVGGIDGAARQHGYQMRAIFRTAVQVTVQSIRRHRQTVENFCVEARLQRLLKRGDAEHAVRAGAGDGNAHIRRTPGDEHADQRIARGLMAEFFVGRR